MGIFSRTKDVQQADLDALLASADDPLKTARVIINEMEDTLVEARSAAVRALARKKEIERRMGELAMQSQDWEQKAELAVSKNREDLARGALAVKLRLNGERDQLAGLLAPIQAEIDKLDADLSDLRVKLAEARQRHRLLTLQGATAAARKTVKGSLASNQSDAALDALARNVDGLNAEVDAYALGQRSLEAQFAELEQNGAVDQELERLRNKIYSKT